MRQVKFTYFMIVATLLAVFIVGCSTSTSGNEPSSEEGNTEETQQGEETLIVARLSDAENLDPHFSSSINAASIFHESIYEGLIKRDKDMEFQPLLATEWDQLDSETWEFKLREGVEFHDGTPFTAEAVKRTFERVLDEEVASPKAGLFSVIKEIKIVDDYTVQFILTEPFSPLLSILANHEGGILSPTAIDEYGRDLGQHPVGTGPFKFESWNPGQDITITRDEEYWGEKPKIKEVVYKVVPEDATRIAMVETGEAHVAEPIPVSEIERIKSSEDMDLYRSDAMGTIYIGFNFKEEVFQDVRVRQAINYAINTEAIQEGVFNNVGSKALSVIPSKVFGYHSGIQEYGYDINKAKELLKEAGYSDGFETTIWTMDQKERISLAEVVQSQLKGIGIDVEVKVLEYGAWSEAAANGETGMFISSWRNATGDADYIQYHLFHSSSQGSTGNYFFYENPRVDELIEQGRQEYDEDKRIEIYEEIQDIEIEEAVFVPVHYLENTAAIGKNVKGLYMSPSNYLMINDVSIK
ncbi:glutathione ABC transporter substrate-binding protein [Aquibacillus albus]|uniref:Peptide/nickel transport system substrate-binding protein n=1 Tax=Aquibacillus albus TaxID=1168171 RepID=A0ABS2MVZ3_9BACI|nr:glutathione ABC transporter substrate-binding protein [Aquibacillus albus]MBM7570043.1 peptide/nickel transport system substrate-binding protein [Aquibacillus albus]